jgi:predicted dehydrogenase
MTAAPEHRPRPEFRIGLIGCGRLAERGYIQAADRAAGVRLVAVADPVRSRRERLAPALPGFDGAEELVAVVPVDGLVLATPAEAHLHDARVAAAAGLPSLIEKPPAADAAEAASLVNLDPLPSVGFNRRFEPSLQDAATALKGADGLDLTLEHRGRRGGWQPYTEQQEDALLTLGPHLLDLVSWLTGSPIENVRAREVADRKAVLELQLGGGRATVQCRTDRPHRERVVARRPGGRVVLRRVVGGLPRYALARLRPTGHSPLVATLTSQLEAFAQTSRGKADPRLGTATDGLAVMAAIDAARRSAAARGSWESVAVGNAERAGPKSAFSKEDHGCARY